MESLRGLGLMQEGNSKRVKDEGNKLDLPEAHLV